jgi:hypothetical protein
MVIMRPAQQIENERASPDEWPPHDLEWLKACPVCGDGQRQILFSGLRDLAFRVRSGGVDDVAMRMPNCIS